MGGGGSVLVQRYGQFCGAVVLFKKQGKHAEVQG